MWRVDPVMEDLVIKDPVAGTAVWLTWPQLCVLVVDTEEGLEQVLVLPH